MIKKTFALITILLMLTTLLAGCEEITPKSQGLKKFNSGEELLEAFKEAKNRGRGNGFIKAVSNIAQGGMLKTFSSAGSIGSPMPTMAMEMDYVETSSSDVDYSDTNVQVKGVDEADIIKTDGRYIYLIAQEKLIIAKAYPARNAEILSSSELMGFQPKELFIHDDRLLIFGSDNYREVSLRLYDISDKEDPEKIRDVDFEGRYLTSRKINENVYFVINSRPDYYRTEPEVCDDIVPTYEEDGIEEPIARCTDIGYIEPIQAEQFITVASISMTDEDQEIEKETIIGSGQNVYASKENLYIAQTNWPTYSFGEISEGWNEKTIITKFSLERGRIKFVATGDVPGHILNQFSMDEFDGHFRIATTKGQVWGGNSTNNVYVLNQAMTVVGELEDLAPGEKIYSVRFMGEKGYVVTFKKVDPLFVIDLSKPHNPKVLGKLKIPGYSDYLHPFDENHIIGIGKDTVEAAEDQKTGRQLDFAWYQGVKMAIFDVSDVENPIELHKVIIGDRGTDSEALRDHKAFLFDREKNLLVIPITLAEIKNRDLEGEEYLNSNTRRFPQSGEFTFQGAYVFDLTLDDGFELRGKITHYDDDEVFRKSGYYFRGNSAIKRSLFIEDVLYTLSENRLQLNDLDSLERLRELDFKESFKDDDYRRGEIIY